MDHQPASTPIAAGPLNGVPSLAYFWSQFVRAPQQGLPSLPTTLVGLTSASALAYVTAKATERNAVAITSAVPTDATGAELILTGRNFVPPGAPKTGNCGVVVTIEGMWAPVCEVTDDRLRVAVPVKVLDGDRALAVTTAAGNCAKASVMIKRRQLQLYGLSRHEAAPGETVTLWGDFGSPAPALVYFGGTVVEVAVPDGGPIHRISVVVPAGLPVGPVEVCLRVGEVVTASKLLNVAAP